ncbi:MAG TPA: hypothetical protein VJ692_13340 [Nitrospiraceae bacterium]|nr:hypothetical protein [Nitrospiraceae bacterium]
MTIIRSGMMISMVATACLTGACASEEDYSRAPASRTSSSTMAPAKMEDTRMEGTRTGPGTGTATKAMSPSKQTPSDPLQECMARIPKDATAGQRSFGELTCQRDYGNRPTDTRRDPQNYASGTQGDTLQACMNRIPKDATAGQRMIAEQSCKRDETNRGSVDLVPGR